MKQPTSIWRKNLLSTPAGAGVIVACGTVFMGFLLYQGTMGLIFAETRAVGRFGLYQYTGIPARVLAPSYLSLCFSALALLVGEIFRPTKKSPFRRLSMTSLGLAAILIPFAIILEVRQSNQ